MSLTQAIPSKIRDSSHHEIPFQIHLRPTFSVFVSFFLLFSRTFQSTSESDQRPKVFSIHCTDAFTMKNLSLQAFFIATAVSSLLRSLFGLRDALVPVELSFAIGPLTIFLGLQDFLIGLAVGWFVGRRKAAIATETNLDNSEAALLQRCENAYRIYRNCGLLVFGLGALGGAYIIADSLQSTWTGWKSSKWPTVEGTILESKVTFSTRTEKREFDTSRPDLTEYKTVDTFYPTVTYQYELDGRRYEGSRITSCDSGMTSDRASAETKKYPAGSKTTVYYSPKDRGWSVLVPGVTSSSLLGIFLGALWTLCCLGTISFLVLSKFAKRMILEFAKPPGVKFNDEFVPPRDPNAPAETDS